jgi:hypothetical protein
VQSVSPTVYADADIAGLAIAANPLTVPAGMGMPVTLLKYTAITGTPISWKAISHPPVT